MSNIISTFNFNSIPVRIEIKHNEPFFCLLDVATILGLGNRSISKFKFNPKGVEKLSIPTAGGKQEVVFINEPNLYRVIFRSNKTEAVDFQNWVFEEVLPQIRKTGKYEQQQIALPEPELKYARELPKEQWLRFASLWFALHNCIDLLGRIEKPLNALGSPLGTTAYSYATEYKTTLGAMKRVLEPMLAEFEADPYNEAHYHLALTTLRQYQLKGLGRQLII